MLSRSSVCTMLLSMSIGFLCSIGKFRWSQLDGEIPEPFNDLKPPFDGHRSESLILDLLGISWSHHTCHELTILEANLKAHRPLRQAQGMAGWQDCPLLFLVLCFVVHDDFFLLGRLSGEAGSGLQAGFACTLLHLFIDEILHCLSCRMHDGSKSRTG